MLESIASELRCLARLYEALHALMLHQSQQIEALRMEFVERSAGPAPQPAARSDEPLWLDLRYCARRKGISLDQLRNQQSRQPRGGVPEIMVQNEKRWSRATVEAWLLVGDDERAAYLAPYREEMTEWQSRRRRKRLRKAS